MGERLTSSLPQAGVQLVPTTACLWPMNMSQNAIYLLENRVFENFLFCGNHQAAQNTAVICSLLASCKSTGVNPREYLNDILARLSYYNQPKSGKDLSELLPDQWKKDNSNKV